MGKSDIIDILYVKILPLFKGSIKANKTVREGDLKIIFLLKSRVQGPDDINRIIVNINLHQTAETLISNRKRQPLTFNHLVFF